MHKNISDFTAQATAESDRFFSVFFGLLHSIIEEKHALQPSKKNKHDYSHIL